MFSKNPLLRHARGKRLKKFLSLVVGSLPLGGIAWASLLPLQAWMRQALILVIFLWLDVFYLLYSYLTGN